MSRTRLTAAALALVTTGAAALFVTLAPAQAAAPAPAGSAAPAVALVEETPATVTAAGQVATLTVNPTSGLPVTGAEIEVKGDGFADSDKYGMYIAVCAGTENSDTALDSCVGGPVQGATPPSAAWAHVEGNWGGSFDVKLVLPTVTQGEPNCVTGKCSLFAVSDSDADKVEIKPVAITFEAAPPSSSSTPTSPTAPGTAIPQQIGSPSVVAGGTQLVVFSGFRAGEQVNLTLFSDPITLSPVTADQTGVARAEFIVPADFPAGTHRLEAIGQNSGTVGVATFDVTAPVVSSSPTPSPSPSPSPTPSSTPSSSTPASSTAPASSSAVTSSSAVVPTGGDSGSSLWWLWLIIAIVVVAGIITAIVVYRRNQQAKREQDEQEIADAAAAQTAAGGAGAADQYNSDAPTVFLPPVPPEGGPPPGADPYGLLSGRDHPDNPSLYSGQDPAGPTEALGQGPDQYGRPLGHGGPEQGYAPPPAPPGGPPGPPTEAIPPNPPGGPGPTNPGTPGGTDGPGTQAWAPDFDDSDTGGDQDPNGPSNPDDGDAPGRR